MIEKSLEKSLESPFGGSDTALDSELLASSAFGESARQLSSAGPRFSQLRDVLRWWRYALRCIRAAAAVRAPSKEQ